MYLNLIKMALLSTMVLQAAPKAFDSLGSELEVLTNDCKIYLKYETTPLEIKNSCKKFNHNVDKAFLVGYKLDPYIDSDNLNEKKLDEYLKLLRSADSNKEALVKLININLMTAKKNKNTHLFNILTEGDNIYLSADDFEFMNKNYKAFKDNEKYITYLKKNQEHKLRGKSNKEIITSDEQNLLKTTEIEKNRKRDEKNKKIVDEAIKDLQRQIEARKPKNTKNINSNNFIDSDRLGYLTKRNGLTYLSTQNAPYTGDYIRYYDNQNIKSRTHYKNGIKNGLFESWYIDGKIESKLNFKNGNLDGAQRRFHMNGNLDSEIYYKNGEIIRHYEKDKISDSTPSIVDSNHINTDKIGKKQNGFEKHSKMSENTLGSTGGYAPETVTEKSNWIDNRQIVYLILIAISILVLIVILKMSKIACTAIAYTDEELKLLNANSRTDIYPKSQLSTIDKIFCKLFSLFGFSYFSQEFGKNFLDPLLNTKVQSPYNPKEVELLSNVLNSTSLSSPAIKNVFSGYRLAYPVTNMAKVYLSEKFSETSNLATQNALPIVANSNLNIVQDMIQSENMVDSSFFEKINIHSVAEKLEKSGYIVAPSSLEEQNFDLLVEKKFFYENNIVYTEHPELDGFGLLRIKPDLSQNTLQDYKDDILNESMSNPEIPILASGKMSDLLETAQEKKIISYEDCGLDESTVSQLIDSQLQEVKHIFGTELVDNLKIAEKVDIAEIGVSGAESVTEFFTDSIPVMGVGLKMLVSGHKNFQKINSGEISLADGMKNIGLATGETAFVGTLSIAAFSGMNSLLGTSTNDIVTSGVDTIADHINNADLDWDISDFGDELMLAGLLMGLYAVKQGAKKLWHLLAGDPRKAYYKMQEEAKVLEVEFISNLQSMHSQILDLLGMHFVNKLTKQGKDIDKQMQKIMVEYTFGTRGIQPLQYYLLENKKKFVEESLGHFALASNLNKMISRAFSLNFLINKASRQKEESFSKNSFVDDFLNRCKNMNIKTQKEIKNLFNKSENKQDKVLLIGKLILSQEITTQAKIYIKLLKDDDNFHRIYNLSDSYLKLRQEIQNEGRRLKETGNF